jgi:hypothetical protein
MMNAGHADALLYHPGLVAEATGFGLDVQTWAGGASAATATAAMTWLGGAVAVGLQTLQYAVTSPDAGGEQDALFDPIGTPASERVATVGYARTVLGVRTGIAGKWIEERIGGAQASTGAVDVGIARTVRQITLGLSAQNLGPGLRSTSTPSPLPRRFSLGAGMYGRQVGPLDAGITGAVVRRNDGEILVGGGIELGYWPITGRTFVGRLGVQNVPEGSASPFSFGLAFWGDDLVLEWAWRRFSGPAEGTHRFGVRWR